MDVNDALEQAPVVPNFSIQLVDSATLNVAIKKDQSINELFGYLTEQGIQVNSMRNESNRLEEMFIEMVKKS